ncbi:MAG: hypothetical protein JNL32_03655 [Candidatus Kapabacteria bacterium]|nr:hypothetical protein [Candidatus Kapabacteria bacterium]
MNELSLISAKQLAEILGVSVARARRLMETEIQSKTLTRTTNGRAYRYTWITAVTEWRRQCDDEQQTVKQRTVVPPKRLKTFDEFFGTH